MRGRKPKPTELHLLQGTHRSDRHGPKPAPRAPRAGTPHAPAWFDAERRAYYKRLARHLREEGRSILPQEVGSYVDYVDNRVSLAEAKRELAALDEMIRAKGEQMGLPGFEHALVSAAPLVSEKRERILRRVRQLLQEGKSLASEIGLTPSSRSRAGLGHAAKPAAGAADPWGELAKGGG